MLRLRIGTINCRTLRTEARLAELEDAVTEVPFDIIGLSGTQRRESISLNFLQSGHTIYFSSSTGFLINEKWTKFCSFHVISERVCYVDVNTNVRNLRVVQGYAPTTAYSDIEYQEFLEQISQALGARFHCLSCTALRKKRQLSKIVVGDFNAKIGSGERNEKFIGRHGLGVRNERGNMLVNFCSENELYVMNNHFKKRKSRKWTWISPNMQTKNAIDFVLSSDQSIFSDVDIIGRFKFVSDHRLVMAKIRLESKYHRYPRKAKTTANFNKSVFSATLEHLVSNRVFDNYEDLKSEIKVAADTATTEVPRRFHLSEATRKLFERRHLLLQQLSARNTIEFSMINKLLRLSLKSDLEQKHLLRLQEAVSKGSSLRRVLQENRICKTALTRLKRNDGSIAETPAAVASVVQEFYTELFSSTTRVINTLPHMQNSEEVPPILPEEIEHTIKMMKLGKKPGPDHMTVEMLMAAYHILEKPLTKLFNDFLRNEELPTSLSESSMSLLFKKGDPLDIRNFRPIALLPTIYKLFISIIGQRMISSLEINQPICGHVKPIKMRRGVRQGDPISPALFAAALETVFRNIDWYEEGININGYYLNHLRYADDVVIIAHESQKLQRMLQEVYEKSQAVGLKINFTKTTIMTNSVIQPITIDGHDVQYCTNFIYLGQRVSFDANNTVEIQRRIQAGWNAFNRLSSFLTNRRVPMRFKRRVYESCVEPAILYGCETWTLKKERCKDVESGATKNDAYSSASSQKKMDVGEKNVSERR
ncbi:endonuclease/exonuclease/phosphatase family protein [Ostertagia ostertagi]